MAMHTKNITTAVMVALIVGTILNAINNYEVVIEKRWKAKDLVKILLTYVTPFCVSLYSSVKAQQRIKTDNNFKKLSN